MEIGKMPPDNEEPQGLLDRLTRLDELIAKEIDVLRSIDKKLPPPTITKEEYKRIMERATERLVRTIEEKPELVKPEITLPPEAVDKLVEAMKPIKAMKPEVPVGPPLRKRLDTLLMLMHPFGKPVIKLDRYEGGNTDYQTVVRWEVGREHDLKRGDLKEISFESSAYDYTEWMVRISTQVFSGKMTQSTVTVPLPENLELTRGDRVEILCRSTDGTTITVDGLIVGKEFEFEVEEGKEGVG